jgi:hypothetical protein
MPCPYFDALSQTKVFITLDLKYGYHQLSLKERVNKVKMAFSGINLHEKDCLYQWQFLPFSLKIAFVEFQRVMDRMLAGLVFAKC